MNNYLRKNHMKKFYIVNYKHFIFTLNRIKRLQNPKKKKKIKIKAHIPWKTP